jgi:hypothetical protein
MDGHVHISIISVAGTAAVVVLVVFFLHMAALNWSASDNPNTAAWGKAFAAGWG